MINSNKIICALDFNNLSEAEKFVSSISHDIIFKVGMDFFLILVKWFRKNKKYKEKC